MSTPKITIYPGKIPLLSIDRFNIKHYYKKPLQVPTSEEESLANGKRIRRRASVVKLAKRVMPPEEFNRAIQNGKSEHWFRRHMAKKYQTQAG